MRFEAIQNHRFAVEAVVGGLYDPAFLAHLAAVGSFGAPELIDHEDDGTVIVQRSRHRYEGNLPPAASRFIDASKLSWVHDASFDRSTMTGRFTIRPDHYPDRLKASGTERVAGQGDGGPTVRTVSGDLRVSVPLVAGRVERAIIEGLRDRLDAEVEVLAEWLGGSGA